MSNYWEHFSHEADMGLRGRGDTLARAFEQVALALSATVTDPQSVASRECVEIQCRGADAEILLVDWLNALVYEMAVRHMLFSRFEVTLSGDELAGRAWGEKVDRKRHSPAVEVKGATYTELKVERQENGGWLAQCVIDV